MSASVTLYGYQFSVYTRVARLVLCEKGIEHESVEIDPFSPDVLPEHVRLHPFGRVPVLRHDDFTVYETTAIARYVDSAFPGPALLPEASCASARVAQVQAIVDNYGYWPMVRQVFSHAVFRPLEGEASDPAEIAAGLQASEPVLSALEAIAREGLVLDGTRPTLADCHLAPMVAYFVLCEAGDRALRSRPCLSRWWEAIAVRKSMQVTKPALSDPLRRS